MKTVWNVLVYALAICGALFVYEKAALPIYREVAAAYQAGLEREAAEARAEGRLPSAWTMADVQAIITSRAEGNNCKVTYTKLARGGGNGILKHEEWTGRMLDSPTPALEDYLALAGECYFVEITAPNGEKKAELVIKNLDNSSKLRVFVRLPGQFADRGDGSWAQQALNNVLVEIF